MLIVKEDKNILEVVLDRPEIHNAFNDELIEKLIKTFSNIKKNIRLVTLGGNGKSFCAGADLNWMKKMKDYSKEENYQDSQKLYELFDIINKCNTPVLGLIHGAAFGGGLGLVSVCDYTLGIRGAKFSFSEVNLGLVPATISPFVIDRIGAGNARPLFISGVRFDSEHAEKIGLLTEVVEIDTYESRKDELVKQFLKVGPKAAEQAKELIRLNDSYKESPEDLRHFTCQMISNLRTSEEGQEGMKALLEKRQPNWVSND